jgi:excisionase family DNA binding protein
MQQHEIEIQKIRSKMITADQAADMLMVSRHTLWRWGKEDVLKPIKVGGKVLYRFEDVKNFITGEGHDI